MQKLNFFGDISIWKTVKVENLGAMLQDCTALTKVPNINLWNLKNVDSIE